MKGFQLDLFDNNEEFTYYVITYKGNYWNGSKFVLLEREAEEFPTLAEARKQEKLIINCLKLKRKASESIRIKSITVKPNQS